MSEDLKKCSKCEMECLKSKFQLKKHDWCFTFSMYILSGRIIFWKFSKKILFRQSW